MEVEFHEGPQDGLVLDVVEPGESYYFPTGREDLSGSPIKAIYSLREHFLAVGRSGAISAKLWYYIWKGYGKSECEVHGKRDST